MLRHEPLIEGLIAVHTSASHIHIRSRRHCLHRPVFRRVALRESRPPQTSRVDRAGYAQVACIFAHLLTRAFN